MNDNEVSTYQPVCHMDKGRPRGNFIELSENIRNQRSL